jgi:hypothetical protein
MKPRYNWLTRHGEYREGDRLPKKHNGHLEWNYRTDPPTLVSYSLYFMVARRAKMPPFMFSEGKLLRMSEYRITDTPHYEPVF